MTRPENSDAAGAGRPATAEPTKAPSTPAVKPAPPSPPKQTEVAVVCRLCGTRMYARLDQIGKTIKCPDCHSPNEVRRVPGPAEKGSSAMSPAGAKARHAGNDDDELVLRDEEPRPRAASPLPHIHGEDGSELLLQAVVPNSLPPPKLPKLEDFDDDDVDHDEWRDENLQAEMRPFVSGIIGFMFQPGAISRCLAYALGAALVSGIWHFAYKALMFGGHEGLFLGLGSLLLGTISTVLFLVPLAVVYLTVVQDTANGCDVIEHWPDMNFLDWAMDSLFFIVAVALAAMPGALVGTLLLGDYPWSQPVGAAPVVISEWAFLPWILLSMLEGGSLFSIVNMRVVSTILRSADGMLFFFIQTAIVMACVFMTCYLQYEVKVTSVPMIGAALLALLGFVYSRLLGRLMWYCELSRFERDKLREEPASEASDDDA